MPSPQYVADIAVQVRALITEAVNKSITEDDLRNRLRAIGAEHGQPVLDVLTGIARNAMADFRAAAPERPLSTLAEHMQESVARLGEPYTSAVSPLGEVVRLRLRGADKDAERASQAAWQQWGTSTLDVTVGMIFVVIMNLAAARGIRSPQAWADSVARDERETAKYLATPKVAAQQGLWDAGFTDEELQAIRDRRATLDMGSAAVGHGSVGFADLATTPQRKAALLAFFAADGIKSKGD